MNVVVGTANVLILGPYVFLRLFGRGPGRSRILDAKALDAPKALGPYHKVCPLGGDDPVGADASEVFETVGPEAVATDGKFVLCLGDVRPALLDRPASPVSGALCNLDRHSSEVGPEAHGELYRLTGYQAGLL